MVIMVSLQNLHLFMWICVYLCLCCCVSTVEVTDHRGEGKVLWICRQGEADPVHIKFAWLLHHLWLTTTKPDSKLNHNHLICFIFVIYLCIPSLSTFLICFCPQSFTQQNFTVLLFSHRKRKYSMQTERALPVLLFSHRKRKYSMQTERGRSTLSSSLSGQPLTTTYVLCTMLTYMLSFYTQWCNTAGDITRVWHVRLCVQGQKMKRIRRKAPAMWTLQGVRVLWRPSDVLLLYCLSTKLTFFNKCIHHVQNQLVFSSFSLDFDMW